MKKIFYHKNYSLLKKFIIKNILKDHEKRKIN